MAWHRHSKSQWRKPLRAAGSNAVRGRFVDALRPLHPPLVAEQKSENKTSAEPFHQNSQEWMWEAQYGVAFSTTCILLLLCDRPTFEQFHCVVQLCDRPAGINVRIGGLTCAARVEKRKRRRKGNIRLVYVICSRYSVSALFLLHLCHGSVYKNSRWMKKVRYALLVCYCVVCSPGMECVSDGVLLLFFLFLLPLDHHTRTVDAKSRKRTTKAASNGWPTLPRPRGWIILKNLTIPGGWAEESWMKSTSERAGQEMGVMHGMGREIKGNFSAPWSTSWPTGDKVVPS